MTRYTASEIRELRNEILNNVSNLRVRITRDDDVHVQRWDHWRVNKKRWMFWGFLPNLMSEFQRAKREGEIA